VEAAQRNGSAAGRTTIHPASKSLAEKAAWKFVAAHRSEISWDVVVINPPSIFGPSLSPASTSDSANTSQREIHDTRSGAQSQGNWVHVAVAAEAHVRATHAAGVGGQRITAKSGPFFYQDLLDLAAELGIPNVPRGELGSTKSISFDTNLETRKAELLGLTPLTPLKDVAAESVEDFRARRYQNFRHVSHY